ncbi:hypothetical protein [Pedobacter rhodius]|uniref:DNA primase n=1 Tax=Pedobacter rhodius TaxID=3004098 RepID=A0ABT4KUE8_9SPHI|nr:hypothetical protein [Pedobacter sp. SJ11]MCZ4221867.1 hypothetical protein [Pedobacter sp. SJ11]
MENQDYNLSEENKSLHEEEIPNIEQFQVERSGPHDKFESDFAETSGAEPDPTDEDEDADDSDYSADEVEFADGEGTLLNEEFEDDEEKDE